MFEHNRRRKSINAMGEVTFYDKVMKVLNDQIHQIFTANTANATASLSASSAGINGSNGTDGVHKFKATPEGLFLAYASLLIMALIPIVIGSFKSIKHQKNQQVRRSFTPDSTRLGA